jgi:hypothetical protein
VWEIVVAGLNDPLFYNFGYMGAIEDLTLSGPTYGASTHSGGVYLGGSDGVLDGSGTINVSGTAVTWVSGTQFSPSTWASAGPPAAYITFIQINGVPYEVSTVNSTTSITLASSAGTQTGVSYFVLGSPLLANDPTANICFGFNLNRVRILNFYSGLQFGTNTWDDFIFECAIYDNQTGVMIPINEGSNNSGENIVFKGGIIGNNGTGVYVGAGTQFNVVIDTVSLDQNSGWQVQNGVSFSQNYVSMTNCYIFTQNSTNLWIQNFGNMIVFGLWATNALGNTTWSIDNQAQYSFVMIGGTIDYAGTGTLFNPASKPSIMFGVLILGATDATYATVAGVIDYLGNAKLQKILFYNGLTTAGSGVPSEAFYTNLPNQEANYAGGVAVTVADTAGIVRVSYSQAITQAASSSSTFPSLTLAWHDVNGISRSKVLVATSATNTTAVEADGVVVITTNATPVTVTSASYASAGGTPMAYDIAIVAEIM